MKTKRLYFKTIQRFSTRVFLGIFVYLTNSQVEGRDILRPSSSSGGAVAPTGSNGAALTRAATDAARANTQDILRRTGQTLDAMRAMQAAARAAAGNGPNNLGPNLPDVPNGLRSGGLNPAADAATNPARWSGAGQPVETINGENVNVTIKQTTQQALLHWQTLNVGKKTTLNFDQSAGGENVGQWIAFNQVNDPTGNPTQILGNIKADGQVYLINRNGVIFGGSSQVNARGLTVSSLPINTNLVSQGLLNNPDAQFLFTGLDLPAGINGTKSFSPDRPLSSDGKYGDVVVQKGAIIESPTNAAKSGGRVTLVGPNVTNQGSILTPDGQTILAAGLQVGFDAHASSDPSLRGLDVFVGAVTDPTAGLYTGTTLQDGVVEAARGSITIAGRDVQQNGGLVSTTSVSLNGRIDIQSQYNAVSNRGSANAQGALFLFNSSGTASLGAGSVIGILPEYSSKETTIGAELALRSQINVSGNNIVVRQGSLLVAPNALVTLAAGSWLFDSASSPQTSLFIQSGGQVYLENGAQINVAGSIAIPVPVSQNIISVDLRSAELANSPLQRSGILRNATVEVDVRNVGDGWIGTPLADVTGFVNLVQKSVGQLTTTGGTVSIKAGGSIVLQQGSSIDVSGGSIDFGAGTVKTTQLITGGRLVDISKATPDLVYDGIYDGTFIETNSKFQVKNVYYSPLARDGSRYEAASTEGAAGGKVVISAPSMVLDGRFVGLTETSEKQRLAPPAMSSLSLTFQALDKSYPNYPVYSPTPPTIRFDYINDLEPAGSYAVDGSGDAIELEAARKKMVVLSPELLALDGFGSLTINNHDGDIIVPSGVMVRSPAGGLISFRASNIIVDGTIDAPGGNVSLFTHGLTYEEINRENAFPTGILFSVQQGRGVFSLGTAGRISVAGLLVDDRLSEPLRLSSVVTKGGSLKIEGYSAILAAGGQLDVNGGARITAKGAVSYGNGGSLSIASGREIGYNSTLGGKLVLDSALFGYSGAKSGNLAITGPAFHIGRSLSNLGTTLISPEFFSSGGFGNFSLSGIGLATAQAGVYVPGVMIEEGVRIRPVAVGLLARMDSDRGVVLSKITREEGVRTPISISFGGIGANFGGKILTRGDVIMADGSEIETDAKGSVSFKAETVTLKGSVIAAGGSISVEGSGSFPISSGEFAKEALATVHFGRTASLSTAGKTVLVKNAYGLRKGAVLAGGNISVAGNIVAELGTVLNVSGTSGTLDLPPSSNTLEGSKSISLVKNRSVPVSLESNAGTISIAANEMLFTDAAFLGMAGGSSANGGTLNVSSKNFVATGISYTTADPNLIVTQREIALPPTNTAIGVGRVVIDADGNSAAQLGHISVDRFKNGGFHTVALGGNILFDGEVAIHVPGSLQIADGGVIYANGSVTLAASHLALGQAFRTPSLQSSVLFRQGLAGNLEPYYFAPKYGTGSLSVHADLIDIGDLSLQGIGTAAFIAKSGDIRGNGTLQIAGDLTFNAGQIYPTTLRDFNLFAYDVLSAGTLKKGTVAIQQGVTRPLPLSAGGTISIYASEIAQNGTVRSPVGTISLGWDGTGSAPLNPIAGTTVSSPVTSLLTLASLSNTSVSAVDPLTGIAMILPYGISQDGKSWFDPAGADITVGGPPTKSVNLAAINLVTAAGSTIDIRGGGDLYAYRWISGNGGSADILDSNTTFAVIPGYAFNYSPYAPFNNDSSATNLAGELGYTNSELKVGDQVTLASCNGLPAGTYTLLPARYALLPGALLITPKSTVPSRSAKSADGAFIVSGYRSNNLDATRTGRTVIQGFEVAPASVVRARAEYQDLLANTALRQTDTSRGYVAPRLPIDSGYLAFSSTASMSLRGSVSSLGPASGRGSLIDINSSSDILINSSGTSGTAGGLVLSAQALNSFGAESLLVGGLRSFRSEDATVSANSANVTLDNAGAPLTGKDIILISRGKLVLAENSEISTSANDVSLDTLLLGDSEIAGSGNGSLVRVSANATGQVSRFGVNSSILPELLVRSGVLLTGGSILLDSTAGTSLSQSSRLIANDVALNSGQISISLTNSGVLNPTTGLVLAGDAFSSLQNSAKRLSLLSYSTMDVYGTGSVGSPSFESLSLQASAIRGFNTGGGSATFTAASLSLGNGSGGTAPSPLSAPLQGSLNFEAGQITLGSNSIRLDGYAQSIFSASGGILTSSQGSLSVSGSLRLVAPLLTGVGASKYAVRSNGDLQFLRQGTGGLSTITGGFGADLTLQGTSVNLNGDITLPSGILTLRATSGDLVLGDAAASNIDLTGTSTTFGDTIRYTGGGKVNLYSDTGSVRIAAVAAINVSAKDGGGDAGTILVKTPGGIFDLMGTITGASGKAGEKGQFILDAGSIPGGSLANLDAILNAGSFTRSRDYRIRTGNLNMDGIAKSNTYRLSADIGNILVSGVIDASGLTGGNIDLIANGSLILGSGSTLNAFGNEFDSAGKGGSITLEAGNQRNGVSSSTAVLDLQSGSFINLGVAAANSSSESSGQFTGTLHLRAPRNVANTDLQVSTIGSSILGASSILVEGVKLYGLTGTGVITTTVQTNIKNDAVGFLGAAGATTAGYSAMLGRLTSLQPTLSLILAPGAEIYNLAGDLVLGSTTSTATSDWNLQTLRFGANSAAGVLTLRASGDLVFYNALSDGFAAVTPNATNGQSSLWLAPLMTRNNLLPANAQSWSYRFTSGADLSSADFRAVLPDSSLAASKGSFLLGKNYGNAATYGSGINFTTATAITGRYQVIRTGSGDITINAGRDVYLLNQFASIYSAGTAISEPTKVIQSGDFTLPVLFPTVGQHPDQGIILGTPQQRYFAQYTMAGGNVSIQAKGDIARMTRDTNNPTGGNLINDSTRQLPNNWLYRRGYIDQLTGESGIAGVEGSVTDLDASTTWWVDFSNFFEGVGTLGGGNILLSAGNDVKNVDALAPTNARMASGTPSSANMVELGGGDVTILAGRNIDGGVYYVERGHGTLNAGNQITTNSTRSPSRGLLQSLTNPVVFDSNTWLPTTLFLGKGGFDVQSVGNLLLGPVANTFLLPQGINNKYWYKTYFNTYSPTSYVNAVSLGGSVTHRTEVSSPTAAFSSPALSVWLSAQQLLSTSNGAATYQPWLRLAETLVTPFNTFASLMAPTLRSTSLLGRINLVGDITLFPSSVGQIELLAKDSITGLQPSGFSNNLKVQRWITSTVNVSDTDPNTLPRTDTPYAYVGAVGLANSGQRATNANFFSALNARFTETSLTGNSLENEQSRHTPGNLHSGNKEPIRIYSLDGNIEGFGLFSPKATRISAGLDIGDVDFYLQNVSASDVSVVSAGRDLTPYNRNTVSRAIANESVSSNSAVRLTPLAGDIQIAGPGNLQVLAGRNIDLGLSSGNSDGTGVGITSIGNGRNPYLPFGSASLTVGAGIGPASSLSAGSLFFERFITEFVETAAGKVYLDEIAPGVIFSTLTEEEQAILALEVFYLTLRDTGRDFNNSKKPGYRNYKNGFAAIQSLFPETVSWEGEILTQSRDIRTRSGGDISIFAPGGGLTMANTTIGNPLTPPGIVTETDGNISIFTDQSVKIGIGRIFTLRGGNAVIWSSKGDIAAGSSSRTVSAAPPTRVIVDPQSASVETDLAGLATGGGIGVLASVEGVSPGDVDLIAPAGIIDAGDAGIRVSGNINLAALTVVNAGNISAGGTSTGAPSSAVSAPSVSSVTSASNAAAASSSTMANTEKQQTASEVKPAEEPLSIITVEVIGYGGGGSDQEDEKKDGSTL